jgi:ABC-type transport system substrate-binding protein
MKPTALRSIAAVSALIAIASADAARRPRYGGDLRIETRAAPQSLDPAEQLALPWLDAAIFETLIRLDEHGDPQPWLAISWTHDAQKKSWIFTPRPGVMLHNGEPWSPAPIAISDEKPIEQILRDLSRPKNAVVVRGAGGTLAGTGPFRIARFEAGKSATLAAHDAYWAGRPYLDTVEIRFAREPADQSAAMQLGKADVIDGQLPLKKPAAARATQVLALQFDARVPDAVRDAAALSIDRNAIHAVILRHQGEPSAALLPEWLSGYAFLFSGGRNPARARQLIRAPTALNWTYDAQDPLIRAIAQRIEVNLREAGISLHAAAGARDAALVELPVTSLDPQIALEDMAAMLKLPFAGASPYEIERGLLTGNRVIPIVHLPRVWSTTPRLHNWPRIEEAWLE